MFSDKNYGLPKDLIEAAKRVHEKQLEEGAGKYAEPRMEPKIRDEKNPEVKNILHRLVAREKEEMNKKLPGAKKSQAEEVQFTEEELAEAFAIFLEENFHVEMLTEEDLDYVFENEFPEWLEEGWGKAIGKGIGNIKGLFGNYTNVVKKNPIKATVSGATGAAAGAGAGFLHNERARARRDRARDEDAKQKATATAVQSDTGGPGETGVGDKIAKAPATTQAKKPARKQVRRPAPKPQSFGALLRKVGGNAPATSDTAAGRRKIKLLDARARARTAASDARVRKTGRGQLSWAKKAFNPDGN